MDAIVIMAREPKPREVKTRLIPFLDAETTARLYHSFLVDKIAQVSEISGPDQIIAFTPKSARKFFSDLSPPDFQLLEQTGADLGERLSNVSASLFGQEYSKVVLIDSDSPNLPSRYLEDAFTKLDVHDVVLGPCEDGGYYLIGLKRKIDELFVEIPWSTSEVTETTIKIAVKIGLDITLLKTWYDVDTVEDLKRLKFELDAEFKKKKKGSLPMNTHGILDEIL